MYIYDYNNPTHEDRPAWRSAHEIKLAAMEYEKWRVIMMAERTALDKARTRPQDGQQPGWLAVLKAPLRLLTNLLG